MKLMQVLALILSLATLLSLAACQSEENTGTKSNESQSTTAPNDDNPFPGYDVITVARALELCGEPGNLTAERYYIRGTVTKVTDAEYGAMIIADETGSIEVYGTYSADGSVRYVDMTEKPYKGDEVLLYCTLQNYNGLTYSETVTVTVTLPEQVDSVGVKDAIDASKGETVTVKGIVCPSLVSLSKN